MLTKLVGKCQKFWIVNFGSGEIRRKGYKILYCPECGNKYRAWLHMRSCDVYDDKCERCDDDE